MTVCIHLSSLHADAFNLLSFSQPIFTVIESEGQVEVCIESLIPVIRDATATILTQSQTATGIII